MSSQTEVQRARVERFSIRIFENEIPPFVGDELEKLYGNIYCSLARIRLHEPLEGISTFIATAGPHIRILILFRLLNDSVQVVNQQIKLSEDDISCFASEIFSAYSKVRRVEFYALDTSIQSTEFQYPYQQVTQLEENIIPLPDSADEYLEKLGKKTRTGIFKYARKTAATFPSYHFEVFHRDQITTDLVHTVVRLSEMRMEFKNKRSYLGPNAIDTLTRLARTHGYIGIIKIDGEICAGNLCFVVGTRHSAQVIGHDPRYNCYALGHQINLQCILHSISLGAKEIWMMGGRSQEKSRFLTRQRFLNSIVVYHSQRAAIGSWPTFTRIVIRKKILLIKEIIRNKSVENNKAGKIIAQLVDLVQLTRTKSSHATQAIRAFAKQR